MHDHSLLDASDVEDRLDTVRHDNQAAARSPDVARALFEQGILHFTMRDAATDLADDWPADYLRPEGDNLEAASEFSHHMHASRYRHEQLAAEVLLWAHLIAAEWREGRPATDEALDRLERAQFLMISERQRVLLDRQGMSESERVRALQEARLKERGEHKELRRTMAGQRQGLAQARAAKAVGAARKKERARKLAAEFPGKTGGDLVYAVQVAWAEHWPGEDVPSERSLYRYLAG